MTTSTAHHLTLSAKHLVVALKMSYARLIHAIQDKQQEHYVTYLNDAEDNLDLQYRIRQLDKKFEQRPEWLNNWLLKSIR